MMRNTRVFFTTAAVLLSASVFYFSPMPAAASAFNPANPAASGYSLSFSDDFNSAATIDLNATAAAGYNWYVTKPFGFSTSPASEIKVANGTLTITAGVNDAQWVLATAAPSSNTQGYVGRAFSGGFYAEARIAFDNTKVNTANGSWPAFWGESLAHIIDSSHPTLEQWPGQATGYTHFIEDDFFEYDTYPWAGANSFGGAMHDWYGIYNKTCASFCNISNPNFAIALGPTTWTNFNTVGQLYIPGSAANGYKGSVTTYFNGVQTSDVVTWTDQGNGTPPPAGTFLFSILDQQPLVVILGGSSGQPFSVDYVHIWQLAATTSTTTTTPAQPVVATSTPAPVPVTSPVPPVTSPVLTTPPAPTTPAAPPAFAVGVRVKTTSSVSVRSRPSTGFSSRVVGSQRNGALGTIVGGPETVNRSTWWQVNFGSGADGWVAQSNLTTSLAMSSVLLRAVTEMQSQFGQLFAQLQSVDLKLVAAVILMGI